VDLKQKQQFFEQAIDSYSKPLYAHIRSIVLIHDDADDVLQNTFLKAWSKLDSYRSEATMSTWLFRIATNEALQHHRKMKLRRWLSLGALPETKSANDTSQETSKALENALKTLSTQQRMIFGLKYFNDMKYSEIAAITNLAEGTLKATYHQAVKKIKNFVSHHEGEY
jgi:RNA polymerase sigma-70 factor (ECF subfamily)